MTHATPGPYYRLVESPIGYSIEAIRADGHVNVIAQFLPKEHAALIVKAVNTHNRAKAVLHTLLKTINRERDDSLFGEFLDTEDKLRSVYWPELAKQADKAKALLAEMEG